LVRVGFIVEGDCEKLLLESANFRQWAVAQQLEICDPIINAKGNGNLCQKRFMPLIQLCQKNAQPDKIVILTDLECDPCVTETKKRIGQEQIDLICVARKALESWYLADITALRLAFNKNDLAEIQNPELTNEAEKPWDYLKTLAKQHQVRGPGSNKTLFTKRFLTHHQFDLTRAANHPDCPSATYFLTKLQALV
jgi:hypothetical protein